MRLDLTKNFITEQEPRDYLWALRLIEKARLRKEKWGTTLLLKNTQQEICLYDKIAELKSKGVDTRQYPRNVLRIEHRLDNKIGRYRGEIKATREFQLRTTGKGLQGKSVLELYNELWAMVLCK